MPTAVPARIVHRLPGRIRLRIEGAQGEIAVLQHVLMRLKEVAGVGSIRANVSSGSIVITFAGESERFLTTLVNDEHLREVLAVLLARSTTSWAAAFRTMYRPPASPSRSPKPRAAQTMRSGA